MAKTDRATETLSRACRPSSGCPDLHHPYIAARFGAGVRQPASAQSPHAGRTRSLGELHELLGRSAIDRDAPEDRAAVGVIAAGVDSTSVIAPPRPNAPDRP